MSLHVKKKPSGRWKLQRSIWTGGKVKYEHVPVSQLTQYGLSPDLTIPVVIERVKQLNALAKLDKKADWDKAGALRAQKKREGLASAHLPEQFVKEFEEDYLRTEFERGTRPESNYAKALHHWTLAQKLIIEINLPQQHWFQYKRRFYTAFARREISLSYAGKVLRTINLWGLFIALKTGGSFIEIPHPSGVDREAINDAHDESDKKKKWSKPLTPTLLKKLELALSPEQYRWMFISLWFGLRTKEVGGKWKEVAEPEGTVLMVYQSKLTGVASKRRWKRIPVKYPEQWTALRMLKEGAIKRPLPKTLQKVLGENYNTYAGRQGFTALMRKLGEPFDIVSEWLGHTDPSTTYRHYVEADQTKWGRTG